MLLDMHRRAFKESLPDCAGKLRRDNVEIRGMAHQPPHHSRVQELLYQRLDGINQRLFAINNVTPDTFSDVLRLSAELHYLVAHVHPFEDGNGRIARAAGDYVMLVHGFYYDVIMSDYRDLYLDALEECNLADPEPLVHFLEFSYLETLRRISGFFDIVD
jgi:Fic family protein